jgi:WXXGXW repeat (2 copies)
MTRRIAAGLLVAVMSTVTLLDIGTTASAEPVVIEKVMPAAIVETVPPPRAGFGWVPGHWVFRGHEWFWNKGHYEHGVIAPMPAVLVEPVPVAPSPRHMWVKGHWGWEGGRWAWHHGLWLAP